MAKQTPSAGDILMEKFLEPNGITVHKFATTIGQQQINIAKIIRGERSVTPKMAKLFAAALGTTPEYWLDIDSRYQLSKVDDVDVEQLVDDELYEDHGFILSQSMMNDAIIGRAVQGAFVAACLYPPARETLVKSVNEYLLCKRIIIPGFGDDIHCECEIPYAEIGMFAQFLTAIGTDSKVVDKEIMAQVRQMRAQAAECHDGE